MTALRGPALGAIVVRLRYRRCGVLGSVERFGEFVHRRDA